MDWQLEAAPLAQQQNCGPLGPISPTLAWLGKLILNLAWAQIYLRRCLLGSGGWKILYLMPKLWPPVWNSSHDLKLRVGENKKCRHRCTSVTSATMASASEKTQQ